jgi:hypothetical protein
MESGNVYFSRVTVVNRATPALVARARSQSFYVDDTPPRGGLVSFKLKFPPRFEKQPFFPQNVSGVHLRVRLRGFEDRESGIFYYNVSLFANDTRRGTVTELLSESTSERFVDTGPLPTLVANVTLVVRVVATNRVGLEQESPSWSPSRVLGTASPRRTAQKLWWKLAVHQACCYAVAM